MGQQPKYVGVITLNKDAKFDVLVVDHLPGDKQFAFVVTPATLKGIQHMIEVVEETVADEEIPENLVPVEMEKDFKTTPDAAKWTVDHQSEHVYFGCPRCGERHSLRIPPFDVNANGDVRPSFKCPKCKTHRYLHLNDCEELCVGTFAN